VTAGMSKDNSIFFIQLNNDFFCWSDTTVAKLNKKFSVFVPGFNVSRLKKKITPFLNFQPTGKKIEMNFIGKFILKVMFMNRRIFSLLASLFFSITGICQKPDTLVNKLDSLNKKTDTTGGQTNIISPLAYSENTKINFSTYFILLGSDLKQQITAPFHQTGKEWLCIGGYALATTALSFADEPIQRFAIKLHNNSETISSVSNYVTRFGGNYEIYSLAALGTYGFVFNNKKMQTTTLLATQAYLTAGAIESIVKFIAGRQRPAYYNPNEPEPEPTFHGPFSKVGDRYKREKNKQLFSIRTYHSGFCRCCGLRDGI